MAHTCAQVRSEELSFPPDMGEPRGVGFKLLQRSGSGSAIQPHPAGETQPTKKHFVLEMELPGAIL